MQLSIKENLREVGFLGLRLFFGGVMAYHGYGKIFGGRMDKFAEGVGQMGFPFPEFFAWASALSELAGGVFLALGLWTRPAAFFILSTMSVAFFIRHRLDPFKVKELALAYGTVAFAFLMAGGGRWSLDRLLSKKK
ncbi:MAG TPA: DoxX family protein [bacterium]|nr:DoxX family protein [bacterium]